MKWAYGVTTVPERRLTVLPLTLKSLAAAGFDQPHIFIDGSSARLATAIEAKHRPPLAITSRRHGLGVVRAWHLALWDLWTTYPGADYYALFQDDITCCRNLLPFLRGSRLPTDGYLNLYTDTANANLLGTDWQPPKGYVGWYKSDQTGRGALALAFPAHVVEVLLSFSKWLRPSFTLGQAVDGLIAEALRPTMYREYVHNPSLVQHVGQQSSIGHPFTQSPCFPGENYDALSIR